MATPPTTERPPTDDEKSVGELVIDISEKTSVLIREEIELARAEVTEKVTKLVRGGVVGIAAGLFLIAFLAMLMHAIAWLLNDLFFGDTIWLGFAVEAFIWLAIAGAAGLIAYRSLQAGAPPTPDMAIEEAKLTKETFESGPTPPPRGVEENGK
jgi:hypothetical protein